MTRQLDALPAWIGGGCRLDGYSSFGHRGWVAAVPPVMSDITFSLPEPRANRDRRFFLRPSESHDRPGLSSYIHNDREVARFFQPKANFRITSLTLKELVQSLDLFQRALFLSQNRMEISEGRSTRASSSGVMSCTFSLGGAILFAHHRRFHKNAASSFRYGSSSS